MLPEEHFLFGKGRQNGHLIAFLVAGLRKYGVLTDVKILNRNPKTTDAPLKLLSKTHVWKTIRNVEHSVTFRNSSVIINCYYNGMKNVQGIKKNTSSKTTLEIQTEKASVGGATH